MLRVPMIILAVLYLAFSVFTAGVGAFADGGTIPERILISLIHPTAATCSSWRSPFRALRKWLGSR